LPHCQNIFQASKFQPRQAVCGEPACQQRRRADYHKEKLASDPEYREGCRDSPRKWRARNPGYWSNTGSACPGVESLPSESARPVYHGDGHAESSAGVAGRSLSGAEAEDLYRPHTFGRGRTRILIPRSANVESLLSGHLDPAQSEAFEHHHYQHAVLRPGQHPLQYDHCHFNTTIATAIADRLVENSEIFLLGGPSLRNPGRNTDSPEE
jgi:hypothetical protein